MDESVRTINKVPERKVYGLIKIKNVTCKVTLTEVKETFFGQLKVKVQVNEGRLLEGQWAAKKNFAIIKVVSDEEIITSRLDKSSLNVGDEIEFSINQIDNGFGSVPDGCHTTIEKNDFSVSGSVSGNPLFPDIKHFWLKLHQDPTLGSFSEVIDKTRTSIEVLVRAYRSEIHNHICRVEGIALAPASAQEQVRHKTEGDWTFKDKSGELHRLRMDENFELTPLTECATMKINKRTNHITDRGESYVILTDDYRYTLSDDMFIASVNQRTKEFEDE